MKNKIINSQLTNFATYQMIKRDCLALAENVFKFKNLPTDIDVSYINSCLVRRGAIAFFIDDVIGLVAMPFTSILKKDIYNRPTQIRIDFPNGMKSRILNKDEFVIMYDNSGRYPLYMDICQYAERLSLMIRTIDINISQQKTPRIWKTSSEKEKSLKDLLNNVDSFVNSVTTYEDINLDDTSCICEPAPYVADKIETSYANCWNSFLRFIGISNIAHQKKERQIRDEVQALLGGTIASRFSRFEPRQRAIEEINLKFADWIDFPIEVSYYDDLPTTEESEEESEYV